jgi:hypothetical protein
VIFLGFRVLLMWFLAGFGLGLLLGVCLGFFFCGLALVVPVYILGVLRGALRFLINLSYL